MIPLVPEWDGFASPGLRLRPERPHLAGLWSPDLLVCQDREPHRAEARKMQALPVDAAFGVKQNPGGQEF